jgi:hypothetical protein
MPRPQPDPTPDRDGLWPSCDDERPGVSIRPLTHTDLPALLAHLDQHHRHQDPGDIVGSGGRRRCSPCGCAPASAALGPLPTPSTGADRPPNAPAGHAAFPGGWPRYWPQA